MPTKSSIARPQHALGRLVDAFFVVDHAWRVAFAHVRPDDLTAEPAGELIGRSLWDAVLHSLGDLPADDLRRAMAERAPIAFEAHHPKRRLWLEVRAYPAAEGLVVYVTDVAQRRRARAALRESESRFRVMADTAPVMIWMTDAEGRADWFNRPWLEFSGRPAEREVGDGWEDGLAPEDRERRRVEFGRALAERRPFEAEYRRRRYDGEWRWMLDSGVPRFDADGAFAGFIGSCVDITPRREAEQAVAGLLESERAARAAAADASRARTEFLAVMTHELNTPLNVIGGYAQMLLEGLRGPVTGPQRQALERLRAGQRRLADMVHDILEYTRVTAGGASLACVDLPVRSVIADVIEATAAALTSSEMALAEAPPSCDATVHADPACVKRVLCQLLENAAKFTVGAGTVRIDCRETADAGGARWVDVTVRDSGPGIAPGDRERVFEPFMQADRALTRSAEGSGIGLALARELAREMGGDLTVEIGLGAGAAFTLRLPAAGGRQAPAAGGQGAGE